MMDLLASFSVNLPGDVDPLALLEEGLRPASPDGRADWPALSLEEVAAMLPAYEIRRVVGQGGMGTVCEAVQRDLQRRVAIKLLSPALANTPGLAGRFRYESRLMASLQHPGIVQVHEAGETAEGHLYYVMEFIDGEDLASRMRRGRLSAEEAVGLVADVADALQAAHRLGIVHRDVKPGNVLLSSLGDRPRLGDFGLALTAEQAADPLRLTRAGTTVGTVEYAAPEQLDRHLPVTAASDVYSLGVLTYEVLTGELPRGNFDPPSVRNPSMDPAFDSVVLRALQADPDRRYPDAGAFRAAFLHAADRRQQQAARDRAVRRQLVRRAWLVAVSAAVAVTTGGSAVLAWRAGREADTRRTAAEGAEQRMAGLFQYLLTDLRQRLERTGNLEAMDSVLEKAVEHFRQHHVESGKSPETALQLADVLVTRAHVIGVRGLAREADDLHSEALRLVESARAAEPRSKDIALRYFKALRDRAQHRRLSKNFDGATDDAGRMMTGSAALEREWPGTETRYARVEALIAMAATHGHSGRLAEARDRFLQARALLAPLVQDGAGSREYADKLADLDASLGSNAEAMGDFAEMLRHFTSWHDFVVRRHGRDSDMYSYAAFRMGVALRKLNRAEEALPYANDALRLAERECTRFPGHRGLLNHLAWCLDLAVQCQEALGHDAEAAALRGRKAEVAARLAASPEGGTDSLEAAFERLVHDDATGRESCWSFCQRLQRAAEVLPDASAKLRFYEDWRLKATEAVATKEAGSFARLVPAFVNNRLASGILRQNPARSASHAREALALRKGVAAAHPDDAELQRDVISSACHVVEALLAGDDPASGQKALEELAACALSVSDAAAQRRDIGLFYAQRGAALIESAVARWPEKADAFHAAGAAIAAALLDRQLPASGDEPGIARLRARLQGGATP